ncbi:MAG: nicotinamide mononucleotide transporter [Bacteroidales bacterium]|nr:nicotinamide mononucleotide transporter [Bacteroidales bacterium]
MNDEKFNKWFNVFILAGMSICVILSCIGKLQQPDARVFLLILSAFGALMGVVSTVCSANGSIWTFVFGLLDVAIYSYILFDSKNPSQFLLHVFYMIPMEFVGFFQWRKKGAGAKKQVKAQRIGKASEWLKFAAIFIGVFAASAGISWFILSKSGSDFTAGKIILDALVTTANIVAFAMGAFAYMEQWYLWTLVNISSVILWTTTLIHDPSAGYAIIPLVKYSFYFINGLNGIRIWLKLSRSEA